MDTQDPSHVCLCSSPTISRIQDFETSLAAFCLRLELCGLGTAHSSERASFENAIYRISGSHFCLEEFCGQVTHTYQLHYPLKASKVISSRFPEDNIIHQSITYYSAEGLHSIFPVVKVKTLRELFDEYVQSRSGGISRVSSKASLFAFTAFIAKIHGHHPAFLNADPDAYIQVVLGLLPVILLEKHDTRTLECLVFLVSITT